MLKGKATIQLKNAETGKIEYEKTEENMITSAISNLLNPNCIFDLFCISDYRADYLRAYTPIKNLIGGIMLFSSEITEDTNNIIPSSSLITDFTGCANIEFSGDSYYRGTLNTTESSEIENGYRYVWDFGTNCANGGISSICLSSKACNLNKSDNDDTTTNIFVDFGNAPINSSKFTNGSNQFNRILPPFEYQELGDFIGFKDKNNLLFIRYTSYTDTNTNEIITGYIITTLTINNKIGINTDLGYKSSFSDISSDIISKSEKFIKVDKINGLGISSPIFMTLEDNKVAVISYEYSSSSLILKIYLRFIDIVNSTVSETRILNFGDINCGSGSPLIYYTNNKLYITNQVNTNLYIVNLEDETFRNITLPKKAYRAVKFLDGVVFTDYQNSSSSRSLYFLKNDYTFTKWDFTLNSGNSSILFNNFIFDSTIYPYPLFIVSSASTPSNTRTDYLNLCIFNPFMISINNISPIVKHQSQVLKIIYEIKEV